MSNLRVNSQLPMGIAWNWVKASFAIFREKPINFILFALGFVVFSILPIMGSFFAVLVAARIYLTAKYVEDGQPVGVSLNLSLIFRQRNIVSYALFNVLFDFVVTSLVWESMAALGIDTSNTVNMLSDRRSIYILVFASAVRAVFLGISLVITVFNPEVRVFQSLKLNWRFLLKNSAVVILGVLLLLPFLLVPLYIFALVSLSVANAVISIIALIIVVVLMLLFISVTTIFSYKLYKNGISHE